MLLVEEPVAVDARQPDSLDIKRDVHETQPSFDMVDNKSHRPPSSSDRVNSPTLRPLNDEFASDIPAIPAIEEADFVKPFWVYALSTLSMLILLFLAYTRQFLRTHVLRRRRVGSNYRPGYAPLVGEFDEFWNTCFYRRIRDCFNRPIDSRPSRVIGVMERVSTDYNWSMQLTGRILPVINMSSYNYLGFAEDTPSVTRQVLQQMDIYGTASCSAPLEVGQSNPLAQLEKEFAHFVGKEDALVCGMGFGTNFRGLPTLLDDETLVLSDAYNHRSLVNGMRASGATVRPFRHNDYDEMERILHEAVVCGQSIKSAAKHRPSVSSTSSSSSFSSVGSRGGAEGEPAYKPWRRVVLIVEGVYSMEGEIVDLARIVALKKRYKALLFVDEAHSIGALGRTGRGVCEHCGVDPKDVDVLMGTFTKSFGSVGGYLAADKVLIDYLRLHSSIALQCDTLTPACAQQALSVLHVILGKDGTDLGRKRIQQLKENSRFLRQGLIKAGYVVLGDDSSPVVPLMSYNDCKLGVISRECLARGLAVVVVSYPATPLNESRIRFCVSADHTREDLQYTIDAMEEVNKCVYLKFNQKLLQ